MRFMGLIFCLLAGCMASPAVQMFGAVRHDITLQGIDFVVFHKGDQVEVIRMGYLGRAARRQVPALMREAVYRTTGCRVRGAWRTGLPGDTGEARGVVTCARAPPDVP